MIEIRTFIECQRENCEVVRYYISIGRRDIGWPGDEPRIDERRCSNNFWSDQRYIHILQP